MRSGVIAVRDKNETRLETSNNGQIFDLKENLPASQSSKITKNEERPVTMNRFSPHCDLST